MLGELARQLGWATRASLHHDRLPTWPDQPDAENRDCQCSSSTTTIAPALAAQPQSVQVLRVEARGELRAVEPSAANGHQYRLTFDDGFVPDGGLVGSAWYEVVLKYQ